MSYGKAFCLFLMMAGFFGMCAAGAWEASARNRQYTCRFGYVLLVTNSSIVCIPGYRP